jgi:hypothetical protein
MSNMNGLMQRLSANKNRVHQIAFALMVLPPIPMYFAAQRHAGGWIWFLLGFIILGNLLALITR